MRAVCPVNLAQQIPDILAGIRLDENGGIGCKRDDREMAKQTNQEAPDETQKVILPFQEECDPSTQPTYINRVDVANFGPDVLKCEVPSYGRVEP